MVRVITSTEDVTPAILEWAEHVFEAWFDDDRPIDWESFVDRLADPEGYNDTGAGAFEIEEYDSPAIRKIQRHVRAYKNQG